MPRHTRRPVGGTRLARHGAATRPRGRPVRRWRSAPGWHRRTPPIAAVRRPRTTPPQAWVLSPSSARNKATKTVPTDCHSNARTLREMAVNVRGTSGSSVLIGDELTQGSVRVGCRVVEQHHGDATGHQQTDGVEHVEVQIVRPVAAGDPEPEGREAAGPDQHAGGAAAEAAQGSDEQVDVEMDCGRRLARAAWACKACR